MVLQEGGRKKHQFIFVEIEPFPYICTVKKTTYQGLSKTIGM